MPILVKLSATLRKKVPDYDPATGLALESDGLATVSDLVESLGLAVKDVKIAIVNGVSADMATPLAEGDRVGLFPAVGGG